MARRRSIPKGIEAEQFVLRDVKGRARATLSLVDESPAFRLFDSEGRTRVTILVRSDGRALIRLENPQGAAVGMNVEEGGSVGLGLSRQGGMPAFEVGCLPGEEPRLIFYDQEGRPIGKPFETVPPS